MLIRLDRPDSFQTLFWMSFLTKLRPRPGEVARDPECLQVAGGGKPWSQVPDESQCGQPGEGRPTLAQIFVP